MFDFKILFAIIFIIISDENVNQVFSQIHVRVAYLFLYLRSRYICYRKRAVTVPYRMLTHSHSATSLYNLSQSAIMLHRVRHLTCERAWFGLVLFRYSRHFGFKNILNSNCCFFSRHSTINMETYPHLVSSQNVKYHIFYYIHFNIQ